MESSSNEASQLQENMPPETSLSVATSNFSCPSPHACPICCEHLQFENMVAIQCGHVYHKHCMDGWLRVGSNCPICNFIVPSRSEGNHGSLPSVTGYIRLYFNGPLSSGTSSSCKEISQDSSSSHNNKLRSTSGGDNLEALQNLQTENQYLLTEISTLMDRLSDSERTVEDLQSALLVYQNNNPDLVVDNQDES